MAVLQTSVPIADCLLFQFLKAGVGETEASQAHLNGLVTIIDQASPREREWYKAYLMTIQHLMLV